MNPLCALVLCAFALAIEAGNPNCPEAPLFDESSPDAAKAYRYIKRSSVHWTAALEGYIIKPRRIRRSVAGPNACPATINPRRCTSGRHCYYRYPCLSPATSEEQQTVCFIQKSDLSSTSTSTSTSTTTTTTSCLGFTDLIDDRDARAVESNTGGWTRYPGVDQGYDKTVSYVNIPSVDGQQTLTYTFTVPQPGIYKVLVTWSENPNRATNAIYRVHHAGGPTNVVVNQQQAPPSGNAVQDTFLTSIEFKDIGNYPITGTTLSVGLKNSIANGYVLADAIRIVEVCP